jgi:multiple sugar transport system substrate-binding protein
MNEPRSSKMNRRQFLKAAATVAGAAAVAPLLANCAPAPAAPAQSGAAAPSAAPVEASGKVIWYMNVDDARNKWGNKIIEEFKAFAPKVSVELMTVPWDQFDSKLLSLHAAGTPADVFAQWGQSGGGTYVKKGLLMPIDDLLSGAKWDLSGVSDASKNAYKFNGKLYGIPMYVLGTYIYYNKKLFQDAGVALPPVSWDDDSWTWDEMLNRAKAISKDVDNPDKAVFGVMNGINDLYEGIPWLFGGEAFSQEDYAAGEVHKVNFSSPEFIAGVQAKADLVLKAKVSPSQATSDAISQNGNPLGTGRVAMIYGGGWVAWELGALQDLQWAMAPAPKAKSRKVPTFSDPWYISSKSKVPQAAFKLVEYLTVGKGQESIASDLKSPPVDTRKLDLWTKSIPTMKPEDLTTLHNGMLKNSHETPASLLYGYGTAEDTYNQLTAPIWTGEKTADALMPEIEKATNEALGKISR